MDSLEASGEQQLSPFLQKSGTYLHGIVPSFENQTAGLLSTTLETQQDTSAHRRSASITPSVRSGRSDVTVLEEHSKVPVLDEKAIQRRHTQKVEVKISRWSCFLGFLFGSRLTERAAIATIKAPDVDYGDGDVGVHEW